MLNISKNPLNTEVDLTKFKSAAYVFNKNYYKQYKRFLTGFAIACFIMLFLPWTQNISGRGNVTTLTPEQRPQTIQSPIPGRIVSWFVREGDYVKKGDTIIEIAEIKSEYFDPDLVQNTQRQRDAKALSAESYAGKVKAQDFRVKSLAQERSLKLDQALNKIKQAKLKVESDSIELVAAITKLDIANIKYVREDSMFQEGISARRKLEDARIKQQIAEAERISKEAKLLESKNEVLNSQIEIPKIKAEYTDKISKAESEKFSAQSSQLDTEAQVTKLNNQVSNYTIRNGLLFVTAPYDGYIQSALRGGIGETFKEGEELVGIIPEYVDLAVETFIEPIDLPLMHEGEKVRVQFDGWPAIVFSGWPNVSYGTYGAEVVVVERFINKRTGKFRVLLKPDPEDHPWPDEIRAGSGAFTMALLEDVPIWFELWRQLNGFPPNYYQPENDSKSKKK